MGENTSEEVLTLEAKLQNVRTEWTTVIQELNARLNTISNVQSLMNTIYVKRQECAEYLSLLRVTLEKLKLAIKKETAKKYIEYKTVSQIRFSNDSAISTQIEADLYTLYENKVLVESHYYAMQETLKTIDDIIYAIPQRVKLYELINGLK